MGIFDGCLLACDIDGTLLYGNTLPQRNIERIEYFVSEGGSFSLSTGRTSAALTDVTSRIKCISPSVLSNGCVIYDFGLQAPIFEKYLPDNSLYMADSVMKASDIGIEMHSADCVFALKSSAASVLHQNYEHMSPKFVGFDEVKLNKINKIIYFIENDNQREFLKSISEKYTGESVFCNTCSFIQGVKQNYYEQLPRGASKAEALSSLCKILNIKRGGYFAIGDYYNDVPMLKAADISAVPADSPDDVRSVATVTVGSAVNGAVADFIDYLEEFLRNGKEKQIRP